MLKVSDSEDRVRKHCTPNILPCRIHHDGPVEASPRYWAPEAAQGQSSLGLILPSAQRRVCLSFSTIDGKPEAYFRGRKLRGQEIAVPQMYRGVIVKEAEKEKTTLEGIEKRISESEDEQNDQEEMTVLDEVGSFVKILIWNHETMVDGDDAFVKGLNEWLGFAEAVSHVSIARGQVYRHNCC